MSYVRESEILVKSYDHSNFSRDSVVQFRAYRYIISLNRTSVWNVRTIWITQELSLFKFEPLEILWDRIKYPCEKLWPFEFPESFQRLISSVSIYYKPESDIRVKSNDHLNFLRASVVQFRACRHIMRPNWTSVWNIMTIWISREFPMFNFECIDIL